MNPSSFDIKDLLDADSGVGLTFPTDLFVSEMPKEPDKCAAVFDTGGYDAMSNYDYKRPTVQVRVRGDKGGYLAAHALAQSIFDLLHGSDNQTVNSTRYIGIWAEGDIMFIGYDDNRRPLLSMNFRIHRAAS